MKISLLKKLNNSLPDSVKILFAPIIRKKLINNAVFRRQMAELKQAEDLTEDEISAVQLEKLKETLIHAYEHTAYYRDLFERNGFDVYSFSDISKLKEIPLMTKKAIAENYNALQADDVSDFYVGETGGSTGEPLKILLSRESIYREKAFIYHFWERYGYDYKKSRIATFRGLDFHGKIAKANPLYNEILLNPFLLTNRTIRDYVKQINKFKPAFIHGYPSAIANFCRLLNLQGLQLKRQLSAAFLISETCSPQQKKLIENTLKCKVAAFYGHTERSVFAEQCSTTDDLFYSFHPLYGYTEIENHDYGNVICTGFVNSKFPLIRYAVDDEAIPQTNHSFAVIGHRTDVVLYGVQGERITQTALNFHDDTFFSVTGYQLYQERIGFAECRVQSNKMLDDSELEKIRNRLTQKSEGCIQWSVIQVENFELTNRGKCTTIVQKCEGFE